MESIIGGFLSTPPLWKKEQFGLVQFDMPKTINNHVHKLEIPTNLRLGHQMEHVFKHVIGASDRYRLVFNNLLVEEGKKRIGELDFILKHIDDSAYVHVELAYKFYIINPDISEPIYRLMGPNKRDMFYTKLEKLKEKQLPLLSHFSLKPYWDAAGIDPVTINQQCCFRAQLFEPFNEQVSIRPLNVDCISGKWIRFDEFNSEAFRKAQYYIPKKQGWVIKPHENVPWMPHYETLMEVNLRMVKENAPMLWVRNLNGEIEKLFVVWW